MVLQVSYSRELSGFSLNSQVNYPTTKSGLLGDRLHNLFNDSIALAECFRSF
jgi:hypothetical protein